MRKDFLLFLSFLVDAGYIVSFRVTKDKIFITVKLRRWCRKKRCSKMRSSHKYIFYFYPTWRENERGEIEEIRGSFRFFERVKDGKAAAARMGRKYDHQKIF